MPIGSVGFTLMATPFLFILGSLLCGWAMLRSVGNERDRQLRTLEDRLRAEQAAMASAPPVKSPLDGTPLLAAKSPPAKPAARGA
jgi:hypothetical protein